MSIIEPFTFQKVTAFKERMELGNKLNEVIDFINQGVVNISNITGSVTGHIITFTFYMTDGSTHTFNFDLNDFITSSELTTILTDYALDNSVVKLSGVQTIDDVKTFNDSPVIPDTPLTEHSAINQTWAENVAYQDDTVNNLIHKEGAETVTGNKNFTGTNKFRIIDITNQGNVILMESGLSSGDIPTVNVSHEIPVKRMDNTLSHFLQFQTNGTTGDGYARLIARNYNTSHTANLYAKATSTEEYLTGSYRTFNVSQAQGGTTYDDDIVTIKTLKNLGLI